MNPIVLDGKSLTLEDLVRIARDPSVPVACDRGALARVERGWARTLAFVERYTAAPHDAANRVYGVTTGFGEFKDRFVPPERLVDLQRNLLRSHAVGAGDVADPADSSNYFPLDVVRAVLVLRLNTFLRGHSGVSLALVQCLTAWLEAGVVARVPIRGSMGSSGDLCPLCHTFLPLVGEGRFALVKSADDAAAWPSDWREGRYLPAELRHDVGYKEGLALSNGATYSAALLALAVHDAEILANNADVAAALTLEALCGNTRAFDPKVHEARGLSGQIQSAANVLALVKGSSLADRASAVQDAYSLRCAPVVHGAGRDAIAFAKRAALAEINAVTDNPLFFSTEEGFDAPCDVQLFSGNFPGPKDAFAYSQGNFHGEPVALAADFLAIALAEFASISERRTQMLLDKNHNRGLPANLTALRGVRSGLMIAQYTAASLVSENKVLTHPASVDSIPTSANSEDHNSMSTVAARKLRTVLGNAQAALAVEWMAAAAAIDWRAGLGLDPNGAAALASEPGDWTGAEREDARFKEAMAAPASARAARLGKGTAAAYLAIRELVKPLTEDRVLADDLERLRRAVASRAVAERIAPTGAWLAPIAPLR